MEEVIEKMICVSSNANQQFAAIGTNYGFYIMKLSEEENFKVSKRFGKEK